MKKGNNQPNVLDSLLDNPLSGTATASVEELVSNGAEPAGMILTTLNNITPETTARGDGGARKTN